MVSKSKLYSRLDALDAELKESLILHLKKAVAENNDTIFCVKQFNSFCERKYKTDKLMEELIEIGAQILHLKEKLGETNEATIAERICWYCRKWVDLENGKKGSSGGLAKQFLTEIEGR